MKIKNLIKAKLLKRYKRFLTDCELEDGSIVVAHCPNSGSMKSLIDVGNTVLLEDTSHKGGKLKYKLHFIYVEKKGGWACVNTMLPNHMLREGIENGVIDELKGFDSLKMEVKYGSENSRIDLLLEKNSEEKCFVEVKNVTLVEEEEDVARFPDAITSRGTKHVRELVLEAESGNRAVLFFVVNREDAKSCGVAGYIDKEYKRTLKEAMGRGVEVIAYKTKFDVRESKSEGVEVEFELDKRVDFDIDC